MIENALQKTLGFGSKEFVERAVKGGWKYDDYCDGRGCKDRHIFLDPAAWKACGKANGWAYFPKSPTPTSPLGYLDYMHRFIDQLCALAEEESSKV